MQAVAASALNAQQAQAIGPIEENAVVLIVNDGEPQTAAIIAHNGQEAEITRAKGALTFRLGDFFSGKTIEQMRLTEDGNVGIGTTTPAKRLDVNGTARFAPGGVWRRVPRAQQSKRSPPLPCLFRLDDLDALHTVAARI